MADKLKHDATASIIGTIYQFYVALESCFQLTEGEKLYIEKYGDITISDSKQIEVKNYSDDLTDLHENLWKTLGNWLQGGFDPTNYKDLFLLTTQNYSTESTLKDWNSKNKSEKMQLLKDIVANYEKRKKKDQNREAQVKNILSEDNHEKLNSILEKFQILDSSPIGEDLYSKIKDTRASHILTENRNDYINSLLGFIIAPESVASNNWEISYEAFSQRIQSLTEQYCTQTKIFPQIQKTISSDEIIEKKTHLFVKKIEDINYSEVKNDAISEYIKTNHLILNDLSKYSIPKSIYDSYEQDLLAVYNPKYRKAKRNISNDNEIEKRSKDFYDEITGESSQPFANFNNTPHYFRNGFYHSMADDDAQDIKWLLKEDKKDD